MSWCRHDPNGKRAHRLVQFTDNINFQELGLTKPVLLFKHSTRCSISSMALRRVEKEMDSIAQAMDIHFIDVVQNRTLSQKIAAEFNIQHESPQSLVIKNGDVIYSASHGLISAADILNSVK